MLQQQIKSDSESSFKNAECQIWVCLGGNHAACEKIVWVRMSHYKDWIIHLQAHLLVNSIDSIGLT